MEKILFSLIDAFESETGDTFFGLKENKFIFTPNMQMNEIIHNASRDKKTS